MIEFQTDAAQAAVVDGWVVTRVAAKHEEVPGIFSYDLVPETGGELAEFQPGAHLEVQLDDLVRHYSLFNAPSDRSRYRIAVKRESNGRGGSARLCDSVRTGDVLLVRGPRQAFSLQPPGSHSLLIAGGIGVTPIMSMAEHMAERRLPFSVHYLARSRGTAAFLERLTQFGKRVRFHFDDEDQVQRADFAAILTAQPAGTHVYICGPGPMIDAAVAAAQAAGLSSGQIHFERFATAAPSASDHPFDVVIRSTAQRVRVAANMTVVHALARQAGIHVPVSCEAGVCGTCVVALVSGEADHRDLVLSDAERENNTHFVACCSRAHSPELVLDL